MVICDATVECNARLRACQRHAAPASPTTLDLGGHTEVDRGALDLRGIMEMAQTEEVWASGGETSARLEDVLSWGQIHVT